MHKPARMHRGASALSPPPLFASTLSNMTVQEGCLLLRPRARGSRAAVSGTSLFIPTAVDLVDAQARHHHCALAELLHAHVHVCVCVCAVCLPCLLSVLLPPWHACVSLANLSTGAICQAAVTILDAHGKSTVNDVTGMRVPLRTLQNLGKSDGQEGETGCHLPESMLAHRDSPA